MSGPAQIEPWMRAWSASRDNPWLFVTGVLGVLPYGAPNPNKEPQLEQWQDEELRNIVSKRRISVRAGHGIGKTAFLAWVVLWGILSHDDVKIPVASNSQNQLRDVIWPEIAKWWRRLPQPLQSQVDVLTERVVMKAAPDRAFAVARTAAKDNSEALQGFHAGLVIFLIDESSGVANEIFEVALGAMSGEHAIAILMGNPTRSTGFFHETHTRLRHRWHTRRVSSAEVPRARGHIDDIIATYGEGSNKYRVRVLGEFPTKDDETVIALELVEAARDREVVISHVYPVWGCDPARFGDDRTTLAKRQGNTLLEAPKVWRDLDGPQVAGRIATEYENTPDDEKPKAICVDVINIGASVVDSLKRNAVLERDDVQIIAVNVAEHPASDEHCYKLRDELWWRGRQWFQDRDCTLRFASLDPEGQKVVEELVGELTVPTYDFTVNGKRIVMRKKDMKKLIGKSPDLADGFLLTFAASPFPRPTLRHRRPRHWDDDYGTGGTGSAWGA